MRVGVTGSSGFIGSALVEALQERGDDVVRFVRPQSRGDNGAVIRWDPSQGYVDEQDLRRQGGFDAVVNLAGAGIAEHRWTRTRRAEILRSRLDATSLLVRALGDVRAGATLLASGSAIGYYGSCGDQLLDESAPRGQDFLAEVCVGWERAAGAASALGTTVAFLRTGIVMSEKGGALKRQLPLFRWGAGGRLSAGGQWLSPISMRDEVRAILWIIDHKVEGPFNLVAPMPLTNRDFTSELARQLHRRAFLAVPAVALEIALGRELANIAVLASQRTLPQRLLEEGFVHDHPDASAILAWALRSTH
ncbi:MAG: TIGR01777 family oxidoreductase [Acidimicrobiales bacterium]